MKLTFDELADIIRRRKLADEKYKGYRLDNADCCGGGENKVTINSASNEFGLRGYPEIDFEYHNKREELHRQLQQLEKEYQWELFVNGYYEVKVNAIPTT